jgi:hypothetical protein
MELIYVSGLFLTGMRDSCSSPQNIVHYSTVTGNAVFTTINLEENMTRTVWLFSFDWKNVTNSVPGCLKRRRGISVARPGQVGVRARQGKLQLGKVCSRHASGLLRSNEQSLSRIVQGKGRNSDFRLFGMEALAAGCLMAVGGGVIFAVTYECSFVTEMSRMALLTEMAGVATEGIGIGLLARAALKVS